MSALAEPDARANAVDCPESSQDHSDFQRPQPRGSSLTLGKESAVAHTLDIEADFEAVFSASREGIRSGDPISVRPRGWQRVSIAFRDQHQKVVAGLYGATMWSWLSIEGLWVADGLRRQGYGRRLLLTAEEIAVERGCIGAWLGTFDFQAREFYERYGYAVFATLEDFPPGHSHFHLRKRFPREPKTA